MTNTPTLEQLQDFKEWYISDQLKRFGRVVINEFYNDKTWYELYDTYTSYANHVLTKHEGFQSNVEFKRKLAALQEQLTASQERVKELEETNERLASFLNQ